MSSRFSGWVDERYLDIAVGDLHLVAVSNGVDEYAHVISGVGERVLDLRFAERGPLANRLIELPALHELKYQNDAIILLEDLIDVDDVGVI